MYLGNDIDISNFQYAKPKCIEEKGNDKDQNSK